MVFRYLRTLEGVSPPLSLTHLSCQTTAKSFIASRESPSLYIPQRRRSAHRTFSGLCTTCPVSDIRAVFDRMFSLGVRGSGTDTAPLGARVPAVAGSAPSGPRRHFLYCSLHNEPTSRSKRSREQA